MLFWNAFEVGFQMAFENKNGDSQKNGFKWDFPLKSEWSWMFKKIYYLEKCLFNSERLNVTNSKLIICVCVVNAMIAIKINVYLLQICFTEL